MEKCKCNECKSLFDSDQIKTERDWVGMCGDIPAYQDLGVCPVCGSSNLEDAYECPKCGQYFTADEMLYDICDKCIDSFRYDVETCEKIAEGETEDVEINLFLASIFDPDEINAILRDYMHMNMDEIDCSKFINEDKYWFAEKIENLIREENENAFKRV